MEELEQPQDEEQLFFRRFPAEKQEQVRGLVAYAQLMGLDGKDLVSIGGKLDRLKAAQVKKQNAYLISELFGRCRPIGQDKGWPSDITNRAKIARFKYQDAVGQRWTVSEIDYWGCVITSPLTKVRRRFRQIERYDVPSANREVAQILLNIHYGHIQLNF